MLALLPRSRLFPGRRSPRLRNRAGDAILWAVTNSRAFDRELARANCLCALAHKGGVGVVVLTAQVQERIDIDVVELEFCNRVLGGVEVGRLDDRIVERATLRGLEILARRKSVGAQLARVKIVQDEAQRF